MAALGMWEDLLSIVDSETGSDDARLFVQEANWDGSQYIRSVLSPTILNHQISASPRLYLTTWQVPARSKTSSVQRGAGLALLTNRVGMNDSRPLLQTHEYTVSSFEHE